MDPNTALSEIRSKILHLSDRHSTIDPVEIAYQFEALDEWLSKGGFLPDAWRQPLVPAFGVNPLVDQMLHAVFTTALEGGIGYWAASSTYHWNITGTDPLDAHGGDDLEGFYSDVEDAEGGDAFPPARIDRAVIARGFERIAAGPVEYMPEEQRAKFVLLLQARLAGQDDSVVDVDYDAGDADNLVQVGLLGSVVFG